MKAVKKYIIKENVHYIFLKVPLPKVNFILTNTPLPTKKKYNPILINGYIYQSEPIRLMALCLLFGLSVPIPINHSKIINTFSVNKSVLKYHLIIKT